MAVLQRGGFDKTIDANYNSVDQMFKTFKELNDSQEKAKDAQLEHLDRVNKVNLDNLSNYVQGTGSPYMIDAASGKLRPLTHTEQMDADSMKAGLQASKMKQIQEMQSLIDAHNKATAQANEPPVTNIAGHLVKQSQTAYGGQGMSPAPNPGLPSPDDTGQLRSSMSVNAKGQPTFNISQTRPNPVAQQLAKERMDLSEQKRQDALEKTYTDKLTKVVSYRSGGLGTQDAKVNQAIDLRTLADQYKDSKTGEYNVPPSQHAELVLGLARLLSPTGQISYEQTQDLKAKTAKEGLAKSLIYLGFDPQKVGGTTQSVIKNLVDSIDRQGLTAEKLRDTYTNGLKNMVPTGLNPDTAARLTKEKLSNSFREYLQGSSGTQTANTPPSFDPKTQKLLRNKKTGAYKVVAK